MFDKISQKILSKISTLNAASLNFEKTLKNRHEKNEIYRIKQRLGSINSRLEILYFCLFVTSEANNAVHILNKNLVKLRKQLTESIITVMPESIEIYESERLWGEDKNAELVNNALFLNRCLDKSSDD
jgi:hypothetical protein